MQKSSITLPIQTATDSDGDGYLDLWEANEGSDPADADDRIYVGNWPYNPDKDSYDAPTARGDYADLGIGAMDEGAPCMRSKLLDQFGDQVDLYDFTGQGKYIAIDISAMWCPPCKDLADAIAKNDTGAGWGKIPELVHNGDIYWITILAEDNRENIPDLEDLQKWYNDYPDENVPVLADTEDNDYTRLFAKFYPTILVFDENLNYVQGPEPDVYDDNGNVIEQHAFDGLIWLNNNL